MIRAWLAVALAACSTLPDEPAGTCGNGVVEPGEDCDGSPNCVQCVLTCPTGQCLGADGDVLPSYVCGADQACHAPSGAFHVQPTSSFPFTPVGELVTDIDGDGIGDVVGVTQDTEVVHFGDAAGQLQRQLAEIIPINSGTPSFAHVDDDASLDLLVPTPDGIAAMTSPAHIPLPFPFANNTVTRASCVSIGDTAAAIGVLSLDNSRLATIVADKATGQVYLGVFDVFAQACTYVPACGLHWAGGSSGIGFSHYVTSAGSLSAVVELDDRGTQLCAMHIGETSPGTYAITELRALTWTPASEFDKPLLAQLGTSPGCPALITSTASGLQQYAGVSTAAGCSIAASPVPLASPPGGPYFPSGRVRISPQVSGAAVDSLALTSSNGLLPSSGIYAYFPAAPPKLLFEVNDAIVELASGDLDGDNVDEVVMATRFAADLKILYRTFGPDGFLLDRIPTTGVPAHVVIADYDGNGLPDIAYLDELAEGAQLMIAYGTNDRPLPPQPMASFSNPVFAVLPTSLPDSIDPGGHATDLIVLEADRATGAGPANITVLHGSAQRTMLAFYDPRGIPDAKTTTFSAAVGGDFFRDTPASDLFAIATGATCPAIWESRGLGEGALDTPAAALAACDIAYDACGSAKLCGSSAKLISFPLADRDVAIGIDQAYHLATIDPALAGAGVQPLGASAALAQLTVPLTAGLVVDRVAKADLDGDGRPELVLPFRSDDRTDFAGGRIAICQVDDQGLVARCDDVRDLDVTGTLAGLDCADARPGIATARGRLDPLSGATTQDLALACKGGVYLLSHASGTYRASKLVDIEALYLDLADVTGDGVDDLIVMTFDLTLIAHVYPQCEARDPACGASR